MIKAEVNLVGTVKRGATMREDKNKKSYLSFVMAVNVTDGNGNSKDMEIHVMYYNAKKSDLPLYVENRRIVAQGILDIHKKGEDYIFYLSAKKLSVKDVSDEDAIVGELQFRGRLKNDDIMEEKIDKNGNPYIVFSAFSAEKVGDKFVSTWVRFMRFPAKGAGVETIKPDWMRPKAHLTVTGDLQVYVYNNVFRFTCIVKGMEEYVKENNK